MGTAKIEVVEATQDLIDAMKGRLRQEDKDECWAMAHIGVDEGLQYSFKKAALCWVALVDDVPIICWGVSTTTMLSDYGIPWLLGTDDIEKIGFRVLKHSRKYIKQMLDKFEYLQNWVDVRNTVSINWLKWCKFSFEKAEPFGPDNRMFHKFWMKKRG